MTQPTPLYDMASAVETLEPWLDQHLPDLDPVARRHFVHLVTGIIEQQSLLVRAIAEASPFQAEPESNYTQVQRIIRDTRLTLETVYYPFLVHILSALPCDHAFITLDETNHGTDFNPHPTTPPECHQTGLGGTPSGAQTARNAGDASTTTIPRARLSAPLSWVPARL